MNYTPFIIFFAFLVYLYTGISALQMHPLKRLNQIFAAACGTFMIWALSFVFIHAAGIGEASSTFYRAAAFGSVFFTSFMLHFFILMTTGWKSSSPSVLLPAIYLPSAVFFLLGITGAEGAADFEMLTLDRAIVGREASFMFWSYVLWHLTGVFISLLLVASWKKRSESPEEDRQGRIILHTGLVSFGLALAINLILPLFNVKLPLLILSTTLVWIFGIWRVLYRQRIITLRDANVAEDILNTVAEAIMLTDSRARIISANPAAAELSGYSPKDLRGLSMRELLADRPAAERTIRSVLEGRQVKNSRVFLRAKNSRRVPVLVSASPVISRSNELEGISFILNDITEIENTEMLLREKEKKYHDLWENSPAAYHVLDKSGKIIDVNRTEALMLGYAKEEMLGKEIFDFILPGQRAEARERFGEKMTGKPVPETQQRCYMKKDGSRVFVSVHDIPQRDESGRMAGMRTTMLDITQRVLTEEKLQQTYLQVGETLEQMILVIAKIVEMRDPYTAGHGRKVSQLACAIAGEMGFSLERINGIHMASIIHDIGKIYVPVEILSKPARLSEIEFDIVKTHSASGYEILKDVEFPWPIASMIHQHHERVDGSGYPLGIAADRMLPEAKIIAVADVTESMVSFRPYRPGLGIEKALEEIRKNSGVLYDPEIAEACMGLFETGKFKFEEEPERMIQ